MHHTLLPTRAGKPFGTACPRTSGRQTSRPGLCLRAGKEQPAGSQAISEDVLARLRAAEEEAARLRKELAAAQAAKSGGVVDEIEAKGPKPRIDSTDKRESIFAEGPRAAWLSERDVEFFAGSNVGETSTGEPLDPEAQATVQRRLLIGGALTLALGAFALVPTEALKLKPSKPMFFYILPILRIQNLLSECKSIIEDTQWDQLRLVVSRIEGSPNNARENLNNIVALIPDLRTAERARALSAELYECLASLDYNNYFDAMPKKKALSGVENQQFVDFTLGALKAAQGKLVEFLALLPADQVEAARGQLPPSE